MRLAILLFRPYLILLNLSIGHDSFPHFESLLREMHFEQPERHASSLRLRHLLEFQWRAQRPQAVAEILKRPLGEIAVAVVREQFAINFALLQSSENFTRLLLGLRRASIGEEKLCNLFCQIARNADRIFIRQYDHGQFFVGENQVVRGKPGRLLLHAQSLDAQVPAARRRQGRSAFRGRC